MVEKLVWGGVFGTEIEEEDMVSGGEWLGNGEVVGECRGCMVGLVVVGGGLFAGQGWGLVEVGVGVFCLSCRFGSAGGDGGSGWVEQ